MPQPKSKSKKLAKPKPARRRTVKRTPPLQVAMEEWARLNRLQRAESLSQGNRLHAVTVRDIAELGGSIQFVEREGKKVLPSGATRSSHLAERYDLMSPEANRRRALTYGHGAEVHGERNWEKGMPVSECINRAIRHLNLYQSGDLSEDHLAHAGVNIDFAMHFERHNPECLDCPSHRPTLTERTAS